MKKSITTSVNETTAGAFKEKCQSLGLSMNIVFEAFMKDFSTSSKYIITVSSDGATLHIRETNDNKE